MSIRPTNLCQTLRIPQSGRNEISQANPRMRGHGICFVAWEVPVEMKRVLGWKSQNYANSLLWRKRNLAGVLPIRNAGFMTFEHFSWNRVHETQSFLK